MRMNAIYKSKEAMKLIYTLHYMACIGYKSWHGVQRK